MREFSLLDVFKYYFKHIWIVFIVVLITIGIGQLYISRFFVPLYEESVTIILGKSNDEDSNEISYSTITLYDSLIKNYMELLESNKLLSGVKDDLNLDYSVKELDDMIDYTIYESSQIIKISVKNESDDLAVEICNKLVEDLKDQVYDIYAMDNITVVDKAVANENMVYSKNKIFLICIFLGFIISSTLIIVKFIFSNQLPEEKPVKKLNITFLGKTIFLRNKKNLKLDINFTEKEKHLLRNARAKLINNLEESKVIMVSSIKQNTSKSYVSFNLARLFEKTNKKVLLVDANAKDGIITKSFLADKKGLLNAIDDISILSEVKYKVDNIDIIPLGDYEKIDLLLSEKFINLLNILKEDYDYIFIDTPAFKDNFEPKAILELVDGVIFAEKKSNKSKELYQLTEKLKVSEKNNLGVILVQEKKKKEPKVKKNKTTKLKNKNRMQNIFKFLKKQSIMVKGKIPNLKNNKKNSKNIKKNSTKEKKITNEKVKNSKTTTKKNTTPKKIVSTSKIAKTNKKTTKETTRSSKKSNK